MQGALVAAGHDVELIVDGGRLRDRLADGAAPEADVLVVDLTDAQLDAAAVVAALNGEGELDTTRTLGFYSHVEADARERAERAGVELVVPRSRMAREGAELISTLLASPPA